MAAVAAKSFWSQPDPDDPLSQALQPPPNESPEERAARLRQQEEAIRISKEIDDEIAQAKKAYERRKKAIKILLLGSFPFPYVPCLPHIDIPTFLIQARPSRARAQHSRVRSIQYSRCLSQLIPCFGAS